MKKLAILLFVCMVVSSFIVADELDKLQESHKNAMKFHGRADLLARDGKMVFMSGSKGMISAYLSSELSTFYAEQGDKKFYIEWKLIPGGIEITIHVNILGQHFSKTITIKFDNASVGIQAQAGDDRVDYMCLLKCVGSSVFKCYHCKTDWSCWASCAGADVVTCVMGCF